MPSVEELREVIEQFERYRDRLINDALETAKRAKMKQADIMNRIQPEVDKIDAALKQLRAQYEGLLA